jgi:hypothetical protein
MTPRDMAGTEEVGGSASQPRLRGGRRGSESDRGDAARVRDGRYPLRRPWGKDGLGTRPGDTVVAQTVAPVSGQAERSPSFPGDGYTLVRSPKDLRRLMAEIYRDTRDYPIIGLALRGDETEPALRPQEVRAVAGEETRIYLIVGDYLLRRLQKTQGTVLNVARGVVSVWWPECGVQGVDHDASRSIALQQFARELELSRPVARSEIERLADARASLECELAEARKSNSGLKRDLRATELDELRATARAEAVEQRLEESQAYLESLKDAGLDDDELRMIVQMNPEDRLHRLIFREWMRLTPSDRREHQLSYSFGARFVATLEEHRDISRDRLAWVCAMIACGRKPAGLDVHALRKGNGGNDPQVVRADGAKAWRARITTSAPNAPAASRLHFWTHAGGAGVEFGSVGYHDDFSIPGM